MLRARLWLLLSGPCASKRPGIGTLTGCPSCSQDAVSVSWSGVQMWLACNNEVQHEAQEMGLAMQESLQVGPLHQHLEPRMNHSAHAYMHTC